jgi:hypothetical protein
MLTSIFASALALAAHNAQPADADAILASLDDSSVTRLAACGLDAEVLGGLLSLSQQDFDQDFDGGWRPYGEREACWVATGELIEIYRDHAPGADPDGLRMLNWHAGQNFAYAGEQARAIALFEVAKHNDGGPWDLYADATIAFLRGDRRALEAARDALLAFAPDEEEQAARQRWLEENPNIQMPEGFVTDPPNLPVLDRFLRCWGADYQAAYSGRCG